MALTVVGPLVGWTLRRGNRAALRQFDSPDAILNESSLEFIWLACWLAQIYLLGFIARFAPNGWYLFPTLSLVAVVEGSLSHRMPLRFAEPFVILRAWARGKGWLAAKPLAEFGSPNEFAGYSDASIWRQTLEGRLEDGEMYLAGWVRCEFEPQTTHATFTVGFHPPFAGLPRIELDFEALIGTSECSLTVEQVTPAGMRIGAKRNDASQVMKGIIQWQANPPDEAQSAAQAPARLHLRLP